VIYRSWRVGPARDHLISALWPCELVAVVVEVAVVEEVVADANETT
jgi:hypothetical protein